MRKKADACGLWPRLTDPTAPARAAAHALVLAEGRADAEITPLNVQN
jgi:hypothetical protein